MRCKEGIRALAIKGDAVGYVCEVLCYGGEYLRIESGKFMPGWIVDFSLPIDWSEMNDTSSISQGWYPDEWLIPLDENANVGEICERRINGYNLTEQ